MFERFTQDAREVIVLAQEEARKLRHRQIGSEHLLLGIAREGGTGATLLAQLGVRFDDLRARIAGGGDEPWSGQIPFTPHARGALEHALRASLELGDRNIGSEHLLLGVAADPDSAAAQLLAELGVLPDAVRAAVEGRGGGGGAPRPGRHLDYRATVAALREWNGQQVTAIMWPTAAEIDRPYRGQLRFEDDGSDPDTATFTVPTEPPDDRLGNPTGITFVLRRDEFGGGMWVGGPEPGIGINLVYGGRRLAVFRE